MVLKKRRRKKNRKPKTTKHLSGHSSKDKSESEKSKTVELVEDPNLSESKNNKTNIPTESDDDKLSAKAECVEENVDPSVQFSRPLINTRALPKDSLTYELDKFEKNALIIFNQENIVGQQRRFGTEKDVESLTKTFQNFGFEVTTHNDLTKDELFDKLIRFSERDFTDYGCLAVAVLTHGPSNGQLWAKDEEYSEIKIINMFIDYNKPTIVTKPKIIIFQACRGSKIKSGVPVREPYRVIKPVGDEDLEPYILPVESDLLVLHSSYLGCISHRDGGSGSWFIQALCKNINSLSSSHDLESILVAVKREVAIDKQREEYNLRTRVLDVYKQMPVMTSTLIRKLYLRKFEEVVKQRSPCSCLVDNFAYMMTCLKSFSEQNPHDEIAKNFLSIANACGGGANLNLIDQTSKAISKYLHRKIDKCDSCTEGSA